jgi:SAM-dependent methyltransferase
MAATCALLVALNLGGRLFDVVYAKGIYRDNRWAEFAKWNALSRVEVVNQGGTRAIVIDADASTYIPNVDPEHFRGTFWEEHFTSAGPLLVNALRPTGAFAIIGPGGGEDVLRAVANGSKNVTAVEINPAIVNDIMRGRYAGVSFHLYERPEVHIHVSDGRSFIRQSHDTYDVVQMTLVDTWASTAAGAFALSENNLYTKEAFREYFDHLKPDGLLAITRWEFKSPREALRVVSNAMAVLQDLGVQDITRHFLIISDGPLDEDGRPVLVLAKKAPFTPEEEHAALLHLERFKNLALIYSPSDRARPAGVHPVDPSLPWNPFTALIMSRDPVGFAQSYEYNVSPVTDDAPFFFFTLKLRHLVAHSPLQKALDWKVNLGVLVLFVLLAISIVAVLAFLVLPLALHAPARGESPWRLLYFISIGLGYILVEITLIQRFVLFLGHPVYALTVVIFLMLLSSGFGSLASRRALPGPERIWVAALIVACLTFLYVMVLSALLPRMVGMPFTLKLLISAVLLIPIGIIMGMPFPAGLRAMAPRTPALPDAPLGVAIENNRVEWAWALNAAASVLGAVLAMFLAIGWGLKVTLISAALCYLISAALSRSFPKAAPS